MENEIFESITHIKNISKKKATAEKIFSNLKKRNVNITSDDLQLILDEMVTGNLLIDNGSGASRSYLIPEEIIVPDTQNASVCSSNNFPVDTMIVEESNLEQTSQETISKTQEQILVDMESFRKFQDDIERKLCLLEEAIIAAKDTSGETSKETRCNISEFSLNILKDRISFLEGELKSKDNIIAFLTKQLLPLSSNEAQMEVSRYNIEKKSNLNKSINSNKESSGDESSDESNSINKISQEQKKRVVITGDSILNGIHEKGLSRNHNVKIKNFSGGTSETIFENLNDIIKSKPDCLIIHAGTNDLTNGINLLNQAKKIVKEVKKMSPNTKVVFSSITTRKDRKNIDKKVSEVNSYLKNYCSQKNIDFIDNSNIKEEHLGKKKLHLVKKGDSILANNFLKYLRSTF